MRACVCVCECVCVCVRSGKHEICICGGHHLLTVLRFCRLCSLCSRVTKPAKTADICKQIIWLVCNDFGLKKNKKDHTEKEWFYVEFRYFFLFYIYLYAKLSIGSILVDEKISTCCQKATYVFMCKTICSIHLCGARTSLPGVKKQHVYLCAKNLIQKEI